MRKRIALLIATVTMAVAGAGFWDGPLGASKALAYGGGEDGPSYYCYYFQNGQVVYTYYGAFQCQYDPWSPTAYAWHVV